MEQRTDRRTAYLVLSGCWIVSCLGAGFPLFGFGKYVLEGSETLCTFDFFTRSALNIAYNVVIQILFFVIPIIVIIVCYARIFVKVRSHEIKYFRQTGNCEFDEAMMRNIRKNRKKEKNELKTARAIIILIAVFCISWLPYSLISIISLYGDDSEITPMVVTIPPLIAKASTVFNPVLYAFVHERVKLKMMLFLKEVMSCSQEQQPLNDSSGNNPSMRLLRHTTVSKRGVSTATAV